MTGRQESRCKQLMVDLRETGVYWKFKDEALDSTPWRTGFERDFVLVERQTKQ